MIRNLRTTLQLLFAVTVYSCNSGGENNINNTEQFRNQIDSIEFRGLASGFSQGKELFIRFCNTCHYAPEKQVLDQYIFDNLFERLPAPSEEYFTNYISDSRSLKASGNEYAKKVDEVWNNSYEHQFKDSLSVRDLTNLITYIKIAAKR